jgi:hypothetical protein
MKRYMRAKALWVLGPMLIGHAATAQTQHEPHPDLVRVAEDMTYTSARLYPMRATALGIVGHDGELETPSEALRADYLARLRQWKSRVDAIAAGFDVRTALVDRDDTALLEAQLTSNLNALLVYQFDRKDYSAPANNVLNAVYTQFQHLPILGQDGATASDLQRGWSDITSRLAATPAYISAARRLVTTPGHLFGIIGSQQLAGAPDFLGGPLTEAARGQLGAASAEYARFLKARDGALAAIAELKGYIDAHVAGWPENFAMGRDAYNRMLRDEQLLPFSASDAERIGYDELAHGWAEEAWLQDLARRRGTPARRAERRGHGAGRPGSHRLLRRAHRGAAQVRDRRERGHDPLLARHHEDSRDSRVPAADISGGCDESAAAVLELHDRLLLHYSA